MNSKASHVMKVPALTVTETKQLRSLSTKKGRETSGLFLVEGWKTLADALDGGWSIRLVAVESGREDSPSGKSLLDRLQREGIKVRSASGKVIASFADVEQSQGIIASVQQKQWVLTDIVANMGKMVLVLDAVSDPGNVGTLIRTAAWFGASSVVLGPGCASPFNEKVVRSTAGSLFRVRVAAVTDLPIALKQLQDAGCDLVGTDTQGENASDTKFTRPIALVLGNEARGMSPEVRSLVSSTISIPGRGEVESLNVASAGAILLYILSPR